MPPVAKTGPAAEHIRSYPADIGLQDLARILSAYRSTPRSVSEQSGPTRRRNFTAPPGDVTEARNAEVFLQRSYRITDSERIAGSMQLSSTIAEIRDEFGQSLSDPVNCFRN